MCDAGKNPSLGYDRTKQWLRLVSNRACHA
jgi:hypothetical protein